jgi:septal ring-binding cell division protein DamX
LRWTAGRRGGDPLRFQPGGARRLGSLGSVTDDQWDSNGEQPGRLETIRHDSNVNGNDEDARARLVSDLISQLTVLGRDGNIDADTHQRLMDALDAASALPQPQPQDQNTFGGMNDFMVPTYEGPNQADGEDRRRSTPRENQNYCDDRENSPRDVFKFSQPHG